jgi:hypothetical protein
MSTETFFFPQKLTHKLTILIKCSHFYEFILGMNGSTLSLIGNMPVEREVYGDFGQNCYLDLSFFSQTLKPSCQFFAKVL